MKNSIRRENCDSRYWWISALFAIMLTWSFSYSMSLSFPLLSLILIKEFLKHFTFFVSGNHPCMLCNSIEGDRMRCSIPSCGKFFHRSCLKSGLWPQARFSETQLTCPGKGLSINEVTQLWTFSDLLPLSLCLKFIWNPIWIII